MRRRIHFLSPDGLTASLRSLSGGEARYVIRYDENAHTAHCTCPSFKHRGTCKHLTRFAKAFIRRFGRSA